MLELKPRIIRLNLDTGNYQRLLKDGENSTSMRAGFVEVESGKSVGRHSTENREEIIIIMEGEGKLLIENGDDLILEKGCVAYCPAYTSHDVVNTGNFPLKYIYAVSKI